MERKVGQELIEGMKQALNHAKGESMYVVEMRHNSNAEAHFAVVQTLEEAAARGLKFCEAYFIEVREREGKPALFDPGNDSGHGGGYEVFDNVRWHKTEDGDSGPLSFMHCGGEGPVLRVVKAE